MGGPQCCRGVAATRHHGLVKQRDEIRADQLNTALQRYADERHPILGISDPEARAVFIRQLVDSLHRVEFPRRLLGRKMSALRTNPCDTEYFDPIRAAVYHAAHANHDEACWLVFLFVTYGKSKNTGWRLIQDVYGRLRQGGRWDWATASADPGAMAAWIVANAGNLWPKGAPRPFGAHRQHERIEPSGKTVETYLRWIGAAGHRKKFDAIDAMNSGDRRQNFDTLYHGMAEVYRYGRLAKFDYLAMLGKLDLAAVVPGSTYMPGATGPASGARIFFAGIASADLSANWLDEQLIDLDLFLGVGMQALEDALCNWQKSPKNFKSFRG